MNSLPSLRGIFCPIITPFDELGKVNFPAIRVHIEFLLSHGIDGLLVAGTTGEGMLLNLDERKELCEVVVDQVNGRVPVMMQSGCISTAETIELTLHAQKMGASAGSIILPYFYTFDDDSLFNHFFQIAQAAPDFPLYLYTFPGNAKNDISPDLFLRIRETIPNIVGIKVSSTNILRFQQYVEAGGEKFSCLCGSDGLALAALAVGGSGLVSGNANVFPELFRALYDAFSLGDMKLARQQQRIINKIRLVLKDGLHPAYFKAALRLRNIPTGGVRSPMRELSSEELFTLKTELLVLGLIEPADNHENIPMNQRQK